MEHWKLTQWCTYAVSKIKYAPDRRAVYDELRQHLDDRCESFLEQGMSKEDAAAKTVEVMGDPKEIAPYLGAVHPPFWGYACSITKWLMRIVAVVTLICILVIGYRTLNIKTIGIRTDWSYIESPYPDRTRLLYAEPNCSDTSDGYTFTVTRVAIQQHINDLPTGKQSFVYDLYIEVEVTKPNILATNCYGIESFWGVDDLGKTYMTNGYNISNEYLFCRTHSDKNLFTQYYNFHITYVDFNPAKELTWLELHYDRAGRDVVLHIDLTGGGVE